jgi:DNA-binding response OmpR family regulator
MTGLCPHCGYDLEQDKPIERAGLSMFPYGNVRFNGAEVRLTKGESAVLWTLMKAGDTPVARHIIAERYGYDGDGDPVGTVNVLLSHIKQKLSVHGEPPIRNRHGVGLNIEAAH